MSVLLLASIDDLHAIESDKHDTFVLSDRYTNDDAGIQKYVLKVDGVIVSSCTIYIRSAILYHPGSHDDIRHVTIGSVYTLSAHRNQGHAVRMLTLICEMLDSLDWIESLFRMRVRRMYVVSGRLRANAI